MRRSPEDVASAILAAPLALAVLFASVLAGGVTVLALSLTYGARADAASGCPRPEEVVKDGAETDIASGVTLAPATAAPLVSATDAWQVACAEPGAAGAPGSVATYGLLSGPGVGIDAPGKPVWVVTFEDACVPTGDTCGRTDLAVIVDALSGLRIAAFPQA